MSNTIVHNEAAKIVYIEDVTCKRDTAQALLVNIDGEDHWFPISQLADETQVSAAGDAGTLVVTAWIARKKGLIE